MTKELLHLHLALHRRSVKAAVHRSITWQRGTDNVALWSVTSGWVRGPSQDRTRCNSAVDFRKTAKSDAGVYEDETSVVNRDN